MASIDELLRLMVERKASDLHLTANFRPYLRLHGDMVAIEEREPLTSEAIDGLLAGIMPEHKRREFEEVWDPDIVLVGEMRDLETMEIAIETAETGHLVFGTLHTNTAATTVDRIIDKFPSDRQNQIRAYEAGRPLRECCAR